MKKHILITLFLISVSILIIAQDQKPRAANVAPGWDVPDLVTDRPDQTESSLTVPRKTFQIETGFVFEKFNYDQYEFENWGIATTLIRYGLLDNLELRLGSNYQISNVIEKETVLFLENMIKFFDCQRIVG